MPPCDTGFTPRPVLGLASAGPASSPEREERDCAPSEGRPQLPPHRVSLPDWEALLDREGLLRPSAWGSAPLSPQEGPLASLSSAGSLSQSEWLGLPRTYLQSNIELLHRNCNLNGVNSHELTPFLTTSTPGGGHPPLHASPECPWSHSLGVTYRSFPFSGINRVFAIRLPALLKVALPKVM